MSLGQINLKLMFPRDIWIHVTAFVPFSEVVLSLSLVNRFVHDLCQRNPTVANDALLRDFGIQWSDPGLSSSRHILRLLRRVPSPTFLPCCFERTTGGIWSQNYHPNACLSGFGCYCTQEGKNENVIVTVRPWTDPSFSRHVPYITHVVAVAPPTEADVVGMTPEEQVDADLEMTFTSPLYHFRVLFDKGSYCVEGEVNRNHFQRPIRAIRLPRPFRFVDPVDWHLIDTRGDHANIDVAFLGLYGYWVPLKGIRDVGEDDGDTLDTSFMVNPIYSGDEIFFS